MTIEHTGSTGDVSPRHGVDYQRRFGLITDTDPFARVERTTLDVAIYDDKTGAAVWELKDVVAPAAWSSRAVTITAQKYFVKGGIDGDPDKRERSVFDVVAGVANTIAQSGLEQGYFVSGDAARAFAHDLAWLLIRQYGAFNSPVWFNVRLGMQYNVVGAAGNWAWIPEVGAVAEVKDSYARPQCSACFIHRIDDSLVGPGGIMDFAKAEARLFKYGSGSGANFSPLREKNGRLALGGKSSGPLSFLKGLDAFAGAIKSGGTSRRAAKMVCFDDDHPDLLDFIEWKVTEEKKAKALIAAGFSGGMEGEAYTTVGGQNANNSVRLSDAFMAAVVADGDWKLVSRVTRKVTGKHKARVIWRRIAEASHFCGCPGVQFDTTINAWNPTPNAGRIRASNPCSEYMHLDDSACNLASLRLTKFFDGSGNFNVEQFRDACRVFLIAQDILVDYASYPTKAIAEGAHRFRQLGLGYADLGALLMRRGIPYDSDRGRAYAAGLTALLTAEAAITSATLARDLAPFPGHTADAAGVLRVMDMHREEALKLDASADGVLDGIVAEAKERWAIAVMLTAKHGLRNAQLTLLAPTGTIGFLMDCDTTGVEPVLAHVVYKTLAGGGALKLPNEALGEALFTLGYPQHAIERILAHVEKTEDIHSSPDLRDGHQGVFDTSFPPRQGGRFLSAEAHLRMMAAVQPFLSGAISKTVNLPSDATVDDIEQLHMLAWKLKLKAVAVYRDGIKEAQPVKTKADAPAPSAAPAGPPQPAFKRGQRKLPKVRRGLTWALKVDGHKVYIRSGEYDDGTLGEVFIDIAKEGSTLGGLVGMWAKSVSLNLQWGVPLEELIETFLHTKFEPFGFVENHPTIKRATSIVDLAMRTLAVHYAGRTDLQHVQPEVVETVTIPPPVAGDAPSAEAPHISADGPPCPDCGSITKRNGTCHRCPQCGTSLGCS